MQFIIFVIYSLWDEFIGKNLQNYAKQGSDVKGNFCIYFFLRIFVLLVTAIWSGAAISQDGSSVSSPKVQVERLGGGFQIQASFNTSASMCESFAYISDYESAKNFPGITESKVIKRDGRKVVVERVVEESILFFPITLHSTIEYTELPNQGVNFIQTGGDSKSYEGTWRLKALENGTQFMYKSFVEPNSIIPNVVINFFIENSIQHRFDLMADRLEKTKDVLNLACR